MSELSFEQMLEDSVKTIRNGEIVQGTVIDVKEDEIREAVHKNGYFPLDTKIADYPEDFINGVLVGAWDQVFNLIKEIRKEKYPFDIK